MADQSSIQLHFGLVVKEIRRQYRLSQEELGNLCGLHRTYITDIEHGTRNVSLKNIFRITRALNISLSEFFSRMERYSSSSLHLVSHQPASVKQTPLPIDILLIEDDQNFVDLTLHELQKGNIHNKVHVSRNGQDALDVIFGSTFSDTSVKNIPRVVLLDLYLPFVNGIEVLERIRSNRATKDIPVVVLTSSTNQDDQRYCRTLGIEEFLSKPINVGEFNAVMQRLGFQMYITARKTFVWS